MGDCTSDSLQLLFEAARPIHNYGNHRRTRGILSQCVDEKPLAISGDVVVAAVLPARLRRMCLEEGSCDPAGSVRPDRHCHQVSRAIKIVKLSAIAAPPWFRAAVSRYTPL